MKKFLCFALALCMCLSCALFASCNSVPEQEGSEEPSESGDNTEKETEKVDDPATRKANFEAALSFKDVNSVTLKLTTAYKEDLIDEADSVTIFFEGNKSKTVHSEVLTSYTETVGEKTHIYLLVEDKWNRYELDDESSAGAYRLSNYVEDFEYVDYSDFKYDGEVYTRTEQTANSSESVKIKIDGTKLVYAEQTVKNQDFDYTRKFEFSNYGETKVELPKDYVDVKEEDNDPAQSNWNDYFKFNNVTIDEKIAVQIFYDGDFEDSDEYSVSSRLKINGNKWVYLDETDVICFDGQLEYTNGVQSEDSNMKEIYELMLDFSDCESKLTKTGDDVYEAQTLVDDRSKTYSNFKLVIKNGKLASITYDETVDLSDASSTFIQKTYYTYTFSNWSTTDFDVEYYISLSEWDRYFNLENLTVVQTQQAIVGGDPTDIELDSTWKINGDEWSCEREIEHVSGGLTRTDCIYYDGENSYFNMEKTDSVSYYLELLTSVLADLRAAEESYVKSDDGIATVYSAEAVETYGVEYYFDVAITLEGGRIKTVEYTLQNGIEIDGDQYPLKTMLTFSNYGITKPDKFT